MLIYCKKINKSKMIMNSQIKPKGNGKEEKEKIKGQFVIYLLKMNNLKKSKNSMNDNLC